MQIPVDWYVHIVPGVIYLLSLYSMLVPRDKWLEFPSDRLLLIAPAFLVLAFIIGTAINALLVYVIRPMLPSAMLGTTDVGLTYPDTFQLYKKANPEFIGSFIQSYQVMVFLRSLAFSFTTLAIPITILLWNSFQGWQRYVSIVILYLVVFGLIKVWLVFRANYIEAGDFLKSLVNM